MTTYFTYDENTKTLMPSARTVVVDGALVAPNTGPDYAEYLHAYPLATDAEAPAVPAGKVAVPDGYELADGAWTRKWRFDDAPPPPPRAWTPLAVKRACGDRWPAVKAALEAKGIFDDFMMAQELLEDDPAFMQGIAWAKSEYGDAAVDAVLDAAEKLS